MDVLAVGLNPSLDHTLFVDSLVPGRIHRTGRSHRTAGGKGVNAARAAAALGARVRAIGPIGGPTGDHLAGLAAAEAFESRWFRIAGSTRICTLILAGGGEETVVNEEGPALTPAEWDGFLDLYGRALEGVRVVVLSGSLPAGVPTDAYRVLLERAAGRRAVLDARGPELLEALAARPAWVHLTADELDRTLGPGSDPAELVRRGAGHVVRTDGPRPAVVVASDGREERIEPPAVEVVSTIGCGDALAGALAAGLARGLPDADLARRAIEAASASARTEVPGMIPEDGDAWRG